MIFDTLRMKRIGSGAAANLSAKHRWMPLTIAVVASVAFVNSEAAASDHALCAAPFGTEQQVYVNQGDDCSNVAPNSLTPIPLVFNDPIHMPSDGAIVNDGTLSQGGTSTFGGQATFNAQAVFNGTATFNGPVSLAPRSTRRPLPTAVTSAQLR